MTLDIPQDLHSFLDSASNRTIVMSDGEIRKAVMFAPAEIEKKMFDVDSFDFYLNGDLQKDPEETKEYEGFDLMKDVGSNYEPEGVFVWFPCFKAYGAWDPDHHKITIYPNKTWSKIQKDPTWYINGQWYPERVTSEEINPWLKDY